MRNPFADPKEPSRAEMVSAWHVLNAHYDYEQNNGDLDLLAALDTAISMLAVQIERMTP